MSTTEKYCGSDNPCTSCDALLDCNWVCERNNIASRILCKDRKIYTADKSYLSSSTLKTWIEWLAGLTQEEIDSLSVMVRLG